MAQKKLPVLQQEDLRRKPPSLPLNSKLLERAAYTDPSTVMQSVSTLAWSPRPASRFQMYSLLRGLLLPLVLKVSKSFNALLPNCISLYKILTA